MILNVMLSLMEYGSPRFKSFRMDGWWDILGYHGRIGIDILKYVLSAADKKICVPLMPKTNIANAISGGFM